jgi:uncharacterized protein GlcG (DUF336 family)
MKHAGIGFMLVLLSVWGGNAGLAETPLPSAAPVPDQMPFDIPIGSSIGLAKAKELVAAAEAEAIKRNWKMGITIVDPAGELVFFEKMDDTQFASVGVSQAKARTAARFRRATSVFYDLIETGHLSVAAIDPAIVAVPGGFPLVENGKLIGGIGCSGAASVQDAVVCKAALEKLH